MSLNVSCFLRGLACLSFILLAGCAASSSSRDALTQEVFSSTATLEEGTEKYRIGKGDVLSINVWRDSDLSVSVPVRPDGYISMPLVGDIRAQGLEAEELAQSITQLLESQLRNPQVTVVVSQVNGAEYETRVRVTGAVRSQVSIPYARGMSVLDVILEAGGVTDLAAPGRAKLYRQVDDSLYSVDVNLDDILLRGKLDTNYQLRPGDVLTVPERLF